MNRRTLSHFSWWFAALVLICVAGLAAYVVQHALVLVLAAAAVAAGAYVAGRHHSRAGIRKTRTRRLEDSQRAGQLAELERLAGRPVEAIIASYSTIQRNYGGRS